jgi:hypothetical protein
MMLILQRLGFQPEIQAYPMERLSRLSIRFLMTPNVLLLHSRLLIL